MESTSLVDGPVKRLYQGPQAALDAILAAFRQANPVDPLGVTGQHFARKGCTTCWGRGTRVIVKAGAKPTAKATIEFCSCATRKMRREADGVFKRNEPYKVPR